MQNLFVFNEIFIKYLWISAEYENEKIFEIYKIFYELFLKNQYRANYIRDLYAPKRCTLYIPKYDFYIVKR